MGWTINMGNLGGQLLTGGLIAGLAVLYKYCSKHNLKNNYTFSDLYNLIKKKF